MVCNALSVIMIGVTSVVWGIGPSSWFALIAWFAFTRVSVSFAQVQSVCPGQLPCFSQVRDWKKRSVMAVPSSDIMLVREEPLKVAHVVDQDSMNSRSRTHPTVSREASDTSEERKNAFGVDESQLRYPHVIGYAVNPHWMDSELAKVSSQSKQAILKKPLSRAPRKSSRYATENETDDGSKRTQEGAEEADSQHKRTPRHPLAAVHFD